ncbi:MAG TPA: hypothetical protein VNO21_09095, partial [Polyangiaceae bacterium]|nr:hypothetical protein [Polyangiaceae bacterium]
MSLEEEIDALYAVAPGEFIAARKALSVRRKKEGDAAGAARVAELAKPTLAAWTVNQLHREAVGELEGLLAIGATLRRAHRQGAGGVRDVFAAQQAQRAAVDGLTRTARTILEKAGSPATDATLARVGETLVSISTLNRWGDGEPGRLSRELSPPGFDALFEMLEVLEPGDDAALTHSGAARAPTRKNEPAERPAKGSKEKDESRATHEARRKALVDARRAAEAEVADAAQDKERAETRLHEARRTADGAELAAKE